MREVKLQSGEYIFIEVPNDTKDFNYDSWFTRYINHSKGRIQLDVNTKIISTTKDITEEQAQILMKDYNWAKPYSHLWTKIGADKNKECIVRKKLEN